MGLGEVGERWVGQEAVGERWVGQEEVGKKEVAGYHPKENNYGHG